MYDNGFGAVRFYKDDPNACEYQYRGVTGIGRCWLGKCVNGEHEIAVIFNAYDDAFSLVTIARFLATVTGQAYRKIELRNCCDQHGLLWINNGKGYAIAPVETLEKVDHIDFQINDSGYRCHYCDWCDRGIHDGYQYSTPDGETICQYCYDEHFFNCERCGSDYPRDTSYTIDNCVAYCQGCAERHAFLCGCCDEWASNNNQALGQGAYDRGGHEIAYICRHCTNEYFRYCKRCDHWYHTDFEEMYDLMGEGTVCQDCLTEDEEAQMEMNL